MDEHIEYLKQVSEHLKQLELELGNLFSFPATQCRAKVELLIKHLRKLC
jgi:hypothetical protein